MSGALDVGALYEQEGPRLRNFFAKRLTTGDPTLADDLMMSVILRAWERRDRYEPRPGIPPAAWLWIIARRAWCDYLRDRHRPAVPDFSLEDRAARDLEPALPDWTPQADTRIVLADALAQLPDRQRAVVVARYYEGKRQTELTHMATYYGVKKLQDRALVNLRKALGVA